MASCNECKNYFVHEENLERGDCVQRVIDPRQAYYKSKPVNGNTDSSRCESFIKK